MLFFLCPLWFSVLVVARAVSPCGKANKGYLPVRPAMPSNAKAGDCQSAGVVEGLPPPAKRHKYDRQGSIDFEIASRPCLMGRHLREPLCLPTKVFQGITFLRVASREPWIHMTLSGRVSCCDLTSAICSVKDEMRRKVLATAAAEKNFEEKGTKEAAATGRNSLGLDDDSSGTDSDAPHAPRARR